MSIYDVTLVGSNLPFTKIRKIANNPQDAINSALNLNPEQAKTAIKYVCTGENALKANPEYQKQVNARVSKVKTSQKERESVNYYYVNIEFLNKARTTENTMATRISLTEYFKKEAEKEREKQINSYMAIPDDKFEDFARSGGLINFKKKLEKEGKSFQEVKKEVAKEYFSKNSKDYKEMIMQTQGVSNNYEVVDVKNYNAVIEALMNNACMVLARKQGGGITGFFCTGNLDVVEKLYGKKDFYTILQLTASYQNLLNVSKKSVEALKRGQKAPSQVIDGKTSIKVASCSIRLKELEDSKTKKPLLTLSGDTKKKISSLEYTVVYENLICMVKFKDVIKPDENVIQTLNKLAANDNAPRELIEDTFGFSFDAWDCAKTMYAIKTGVYNNIDKFGARVDRLLEDSAKENGISDEDLAMYKQHKLDKQARDFKYQFEKFQTGYCMSIMGSKEANLLDAE